MILKENLETAKEVESRGYKADRLAFAGIGVYSFINAAWIFWALSGARPELFFTGVLLGVFAPAFALLALIIFQSTSLQNRFSIFANVLSILVMFGWAFPVLYLLAAASSAV